MTCTDSGGLAYAIPPTQEAVLMPSAHVAAKYGGWNSATILFAEEPARKPPVARYAAAAAGPPISRCPHAPFATMLVGQMAQLQHPLRCTAYTCSLI